jgi:hypothetical protein
VRERIHHLPTISIAYEGRPGLGRLGRLRNEYLSISDAGRCKPPGTICVVTRDAKSVNEAAVPYDFFHFLPQPAPAHTRHRVISVGNARDPASH